MSTPGTVAQRNEPVQDSVVPAYPYDDALASLFHNSLVDANGCVKHVNPHGGHTKYNTDLFRPGAEILHGRAAAVAALFESIILSPRTIELPDSETYTKGRLYSHPDLRVQMPFEAPPQFLKYGGMVSYDDDFGELYTEWDHLEYLAEDLHRRRRIKAFFNRHRSLFPEKTLMVGRKSKTLNFYQPFDIDFTINTIVQVYLARKYNAVLLGDAIFHQFYRLLLTEAPPEMELFPVSGEKSPNLRNLDLADVEALSLDFAPATLDTFAAIRMDKEIREYGKNWRKIITTTPADQLRPVLLAEMSHASESSNIARRTRGIFSFIGTFLTWIGLVPEPVLGGVSGIGGALVDLGARAAEKAEKRFDWCMVGAQMHRVANRASLKKYLSRRH